MQEGADRDGRNEEVLWGVERKSLKNLVMGNKDNAVIQHIITYIKNIFVKTKGVSGSKLDEELISSAKSEEEKALIKEMCEDTERYYAKREEFRSSELKPGMWFEKQIEDTVKEVCPEVSPKEIDEVKENVSKAMEQEIDSLTKLVDEEITPVSDILNDENK